MRVKSIVIDGFKSYAHRKELADLSPHFNAITGLNGSGKSNIFDAICFVMGITNLKRVRAEDPRELIFRAGTTGVHAARVTIEFYNDDPASAPPGYSCTDYPVITVGRQIKVGGKQQFFFNHTVSLQSKVKRFFESISLNIDNPHFLVLQGTVHKLIGMRSQDILSLVEEAVGTKAFDHRRRIAETLIRNKQNKMADIDRNIETQIGPMLEAMRADQEEYHRFLHVSEGLDDMKQFRTAFEYYERCRHLEEREVVVRALKTKAAEAKEQMQQVPAQEDELTRRLMRLQENLSTCGEAAVALHADEGETKLRQSRLQGEVDAFTRQLQVLEHALRSLDAAAEKQKAGMMSFEGRRAQHQELLRSLKEERDKVAKIKHGLQLLQSGVRAGASGVSLAEEGRQLDLELIHLTAAIKRAKERVAELTSQLESAHRRRVQHAGQLTQLEQDLARAEAEFARAEQHYSPLAPVEQRVAALTVDIAATRSACQREAEVFHRASGARTFDLDYDRRACPAGVEAKVLGRVGELVYPRDSEHRMALMVGAQSQLLRVVVKDDATAEEVIRHGLRQRTAFLALNRLQAPKPIEPAALEEAQRVAKRMGGFVSEAKDLVVIKEDSAELKALATSVFGTFFICSSLALAQELAYSPPIRRKSVTLEGEVAEPNGLMTGGTTGQLRDLFGELQLYRTRKAPLEQLQAQLAAQEREYDQLQARLTAQRPVMEAYRAAEEALEIAKKRLQLASGSSKSSIGEVEAQLQHAREELMQLEAEVARRRARRAQIDEEAAADPESSRKELQQQLKAAQAKIAELTRQEEREAAAYERLEADTEQRAADLARKTAATQEELEQVRQTQAGVAAQLTAVTKEVTEVTQRCKAAEDHREQLEAGIEEAQAELARCSEQRAALDNIAKNSELDLREASKTVEELRRYVREAERRHPWLAEVRDELGSASGRFYFEDTARTAMTLRALREAEAQAAVMSRRVNAKATILYEDRRREYEELVKQRAALAEDKDAIHACIREIELRKWTALDRMVGVVSKVFGKLFSTCLPGASAGLVEERDADGHLCGLGVRVVFNGKPKESLTELSGGQRSLLALCLILSILRVRPAPIYILDEVDAALDPSHTQGIGRMLQLYFPNSQFLLVSLKDGMYNNANVLYHVRNTQGYSEIARIAHSEGGGRA